VFFLYTFLPTLNVASLPLEVAAFQMENEECFLCLQAFDNLFYVTSPPGCSGRSLSSKFSFPSFPPITPPFSWMIFPQVQEFLFDRLPPPSPSGPGRMMALLWEAFFFGSLTFVHSSKESFPSFPGK